MKINFKIMNMDYLFLKSFLIFFIDYLKKIRKSFINKTNSSGLEDLNSANIEIE